MDRRTFLQLMAVAAASPVPTFAQQASDSVHYIRAWDYASDGSHSGVTTVKASYDYSQRELVIRSYSAGHSMQRYSQLVEMMQRHAAKDDHNVVWCIPQEPGQSGLVLAKKLQSLCGHTPVKAVLNTWSLDASLKIMESFNIRRGCRDWPLSIKTRNSPFLRCMRLVMSEVVKGSSAS